MNLRPAMIPGKFGADMKIVRNLVRDDPEAMDLLDRATTGRQGERTDLFDKSETNIVDNINKVVRPNGTSSAAAIRRLRKDRPDLHADVVKGKKSPLPVARLGV